MQVKVESIKSINNIVVFGLMFVFPSWAFLKYQEIELKHELDKEKIKLEKSRLSFPGSCL
jgi:hypothetical protein